MDTTIPVWNKIFPGDPEEPNEIPGADEETKKVIYTDNSLNIWQVLRGWSWNHCTSTPHRSETNGIAERAVRRVTEGTSAVLLQSGLGNEWWADSLECCCYLRNIQDLLSCGKTPQERRFGVPFNGKVIQFGAMVEFHPISAKDLSRLHRVGPQVLPGIFLSFVLYAVRNLERRHIGRRHWRIGGDGRIWTPRPKAQCKGSANAKERWTFHIPGRRWNSQKLLEKVRIWEHPLESGSVGHEEKNKKNLQEKSDELQTPTPIQEDSTRDDEEAKSDFWTITGEFIYRHHVVPRVKLYVPREESFPFRWSTSTLPEQHIHHWTYCLRKMLMIAGTWMEKKNCQMHGQASQDSFYWTKGLLMDTPCPEGDLRGNKQPLVQICGSICLMQRKRKRNKDGLSGNQSSTMPHNWEEYSSLNQTTKNSSSQWNPLVESWKFRCQQQCLAEYRQWAVEKPTTILGNARQNTLVLLMPTKARDQG